MSPCLEHQRGAHLDELAVALDALDGDGGRRVGVLDAGHRALRIGHELVDAADQRGRRFFLVGAQHLHAGLHGRLGRDGVVADGAAHEPGQDVDAHDDGAEGAEHVGDRIADRDIALQPRRLGRGEAELGDRIAGRADDGRLREAAGRHARRQALVEPAQLGHDHDGRQAAGRHHRGQDDLLDRLLAERAEELRPALEAHGIDEQREQHRLHAAVDLHAHLAHDHRHQQRARHAAQLELAELDLADPVADRQREKKRHLRRLLEQFMQPFHRSKSFQVPDLVRTTRCVTSLRAPPARPRPRSTAPSAAAPHSRWRR
jgi:hypothetical protein